MIREIPLADVGLMSVAAVAAEFGASQSTVLNWVRAGRLPVVVAGGGMRTVYLVRVADLKGFERPKIGAPPREKPKPAPKPRRRKS